MNLNHLSDQDLAKVNDFRSRALRALDFRRKGEEDKALAEELSLEELQEAIALLARPRVGAAPRATSQPTAKAAKAAKANPHLLDDLFG